MLPVRQSALCDALGFGWSPLAPMFRERYVPLVNSGSLCYQWRGKGGGALRVRTARQPKGNPGKPGQKCRSLLHPESSKRPTELPRVVWKGLSCALNRFKVEAQD